MLKVSMILHLKALLVPLFLIAVMMQGSKCIFCQLFSCILSKTLSSYFYMCVLSLQFIFVDFIGRSYFLSLLHPSLCHDNDSKQILIQRPIGRGEPCGSIYCSPQDKHEKATVTTYGFLSFNIMSCALKAHRILQIFKCAHSKIVHAWNSYS